MKNRDDLRYFRHPIHGKCVIVCAVGDSKVFINKSFLRGCTTVYIRDLKPYKPTQC